MRELSTSDGESSSGESSGDELPNGWEAEEDFDEEEGELNDDLLITSCCSSTWEIYKGRNFRHVFDREEAFIRENRNLRQAVSGDGLSSASNDDRADHRFSVALSGGGVRAAAFAAGVVWRLAEQGRLKDVDHVAAVSGGSYLAAALATHLAEAGREEPPPPPGPELDFWYKRAVAQTICRMQSNTPYLARDLGKDPLSMPKDGSSSLPRIFDIPIMVVVLSFAMLVRTLLLGLMVILPTVEFIETIYGADMRMNFCSDVFAPRLIFVTLLGSSSLELNFVVVLISLFLVFLLHFLLQLMKTHERERNWRGTMLWLTTRSVLSVAMRSLVGWLVLTFLICGPVNWTFLRYQSAGATDLRTCQCRDYIMNAPELPCPDRIWQNVHGPAPELLKRIGYVKYLEEHPAICANLTAPGHQKDPDPSELFPQLFSGSLGKCLFPQVMLLLLAALILAVLLMPFMPDVFTCVFNIVGPLFLFLVTFFLVQWRVLGRVTSERLFSFSQEHSWQIRQSWPAIIKAVLIVDMLLVCCLKRLKSAAHIFYARSMRKAFYAGGEDWRWGDIRRTPHCPYLIFCTTVNDYMRPGDELPHAEFAFGTLYTGGDRTGYRRTWRLQSVAKSSALSGGALDGFILGLHDSLSFRFWLEFLGVQMGNFVRFRRSRAPPAAAKLPGILWFVLVYGLMLLSTCMADRGSINECRNADRLYTAALISALIFLLLSFFDFLPCLAPLHHSAVVRGIHQASQFYHQSPEPPSVVYLTDGGVLDNTGVAQLLRRRCRRVLAVYAEEDGADVFCSLRELLRIAERERLCSFFNPEDARRSVWHTVLEYVEQPERTHLHLCIRYGSGSSEQGVGHLVLVKNRLPPNLEGELVRGLLTEDEILGHASPAMPDEKLGHLRQADLGACCCDSCHATLCNHCCGRFPAPPTANQWLTPQMFSSLCRLGHAVAAPALAAADAANVGNV